MSVKIFTYHATINYGAILQSLSLKTFIENETCIQSKFSDYQPKKLVYAEYFKPLITKNLFKLKSLLIKNYKIYRWKKKLNKDYSISEDKIIKNNEPISIYGSDEIWNFQNPYF